jgi:effector-binding domain-containing protein
MLTLPKLVDRPAQPYVAIHVKVTIPFGDVIGRVMPELFDTLKTRGIEGSGPVFFKFNVVDMPRLEIEFGVPVATPVAGEGRLVAGVLPAGRYAELTYWGHYDDLIEVTGILIDWARARGIRWDSTTEADGEHFASRLEIYPNSPDEEPDPQKWETILSFKVRD